MSELKPCSCGGKAELDKAFFVVYPGRIWIKWRVVCKSCHHHTDAEETPTDSILNAVGI